MKKYCLILSIMAFALSSYAQQPSKKKHLWNDHIVEAMAQINTIGNGFGIRYEYLFDGQDKLSFVAPVSYLVKQIDPYKYPSGAFGPTRSMNTLTVAPGIRFYPSGSSRPVQYSMGASLYAGLEIGKGQELSDGRRMATRKLAGMMFTSGFSFRIVRHIRFGLEAGAGGIYDNDPNRPDINSNLRAIIQLGMTVGYRW